MRIPGFVNPAIILIFARILFGIQFLVGPAALAADLELAKGPILHRVEDKQILRVQGSLDHPGLEWRENPGDSEKKGELKPAASGFWQGDLPDKAVEYRIVDGERSTPWKTAVTSGQSKDRFTFIAYGDNRSGWGSPRVHEGLLASMKAEKPAFIINTGDLVYDGEKSAYWDLFFRQSQDAFGAVPFEPVIGNHDLSKDGFYGKYFGLGPGGAPYYYFSYGHAEFIGLDTTRNFAPGCPQYKFLEGRLKKVQGSKPIVVFFHHPAYSWSNHSSDPRVQAYLVPLFEKYGVDLVITGHDHNYQRVGPIHGVTYLVTGGGGGPLYQVHENPLLKNYKVVYHYITFEVDDEKITGAMKYSPGVAEDRFEIVYKEKKEETKGTTKEMEPKAIEKAKP